MYWIHNTYSLFFFFFLSFSQQKQLAFIAEKLQRSRASEDLSTNSLHWAGLPGPRSLWKAAVDQSPAYFHFSCQPEAQPTAWGWGRKTAFPVFPSVSSRVCTLCSELMQTFSLHQLCGRSMSNWTPPGSLRSQVTALEQPSQFMSMENSVMLWHDWGDGDSSVGNALLTLHISYSDEKGYHLQNEV